MSNHNDKQFESRCVTIVALVLMVAYFAVGLGFGYLQNVHVTMFCSPDSISYREVAEWIYDASPTPHTADRPFLYPLLIGGLAKFGGVYAICSAQFVMWVLSGVFVARSVLRCTGSRFAVAVATLIYVSCLSLMLVTLHALTETFAAWLVAVLAALVTDRAMYEPPRFCLLVTLILSLLAVVKPVFVLLLAAWLLYVAAVLLFRRKALAIEAKPAKLRHVIYVFLALLPVFIQLGIMKGRHGSLAISHIGGKTVRRYYLAKLYGDVNKIDIRRARGYVKDFSCEEIIRYVCSHPEPAMQTYFTLVKANVLAGSSFTIIPFQHKGLSCFTKTINGIYFVVHMVMFAFSVLLILRLMKKSDRAGLERVLFLLLPVYCIISTAGVTFWQGDRIILPAFPLWIVAYFTVLKMSYQSLRASKA